MTRGRRSWNEVPKRHQGSIAIGHQVLARQPVLRRRARLLLGILRQHIGLDVHPSPGRERMEMRRSIRMWDDGDLQEHLAVLPRHVNLGYGEADAIYRDRTLRDDVPGQFRRQLQDRGASPPSPDPDSAAPAKPGSRPRPRVPAPHARPADCPQGSAAQGSPGH